MTTENAPSGSRPAIARPRSTPRPRRTLPDYLAIAAHPLPAASTFGPVRNRVLPTLSAVGAPDHVALTFDDGPDPESTPHFLRLLAARDVRATFFLLGGMASRHPQLVRELAAAGHEIAVHGWNHRSLLFRGPRGVHDDLARARDLLAELTGVVPTRFRPPYGVMTAGAHLAGRRLGLQPTLWTTWGEDWTGRATGDSVLREVTRNLRGGGTILLHDSDCTAAPESWQSTLAALPGVLDHCAERGLRVGPLREHGSPAKP